jgi:mannose-6-phosphate isomerase-like protein (cupin superfamily)
MERCKEVNEPWNPEDIAIVNDQVIRLALFHGDYHWHKHTYYDELFYVIKGSIIIKLKDNDDIYINEGQLAVVPKNIIHCPMSLFPSYVLMFEPFELKSIGD